MTTTKKLEKALDALDMEPVRNETEKRSVAERRASLAIAYQLARIADAFDYSTGDGDTVAGRLRARGHK